MRDRYPETMSIPCAYCRRGRPQRTRTCATTGADGPISPGYSEWPAGAKFCCAATTQLPFTPLKPVSQPLPAPCSHDGAILQHEDPE